MQFVIPTFGEDISYYTLSSLAYNCKQYTVTIQHMLRLAPHAQARPTCSGSPHMMIRLVQTPHPNWGPSWSQCLYYAALIATCQVNKAALTPDKLQLSRSNVNCVVRSYLSPTPVGVGDKSNKSYYGR